MIAMLIKDLRIAPLRTFLTGFSMFVGIVAVIISVLSGTVGKDYLQATNEQLYGKEPSVYALIDAPADVSHTSLQKLSDELSRKYAHSAFSITPGQDYSLGLEDKNHRIGPNSELSLRDTVDLGNIETLFVSPSYNEVFNLPMTSGRWLSATEDARLEVVVNKSTLTDSWVPSFGVVAGPDSVNLTKVRVVGVVNDGADTPRAYISAIPAAFYLHHTWAASSIKVQLWNTGGLSNEALRGGIGDAAYDSTAGRISEVSSSRASSAFADVATAMQVGFGISAALLLFVSSLGLINIGLASLEQRSRELLIRRALGATRGSVAILVMGGSLLLAVTVCAIALALAAAIVYSVPWFLPADTPVSAPQFPVSAAIIAVAAGLATAIAGSALPAIRAARLQPALALR